MFFKFILSFLAALLLYGLLISVSGTEVNLQPYSSIVEIRNTSQKEQSDDLKPWFRKVIKNMLTPKIKRQFDQPISIRNSPNSDRSKCSKIPLYEQKITTEFAGYILKYPCTVYSSGSVYVYRDQEDNYYSNYILNLSVTLNGDEKSIWRLKHKEYTPEKMSFNLVLRNNRHNYTKPPFFKELEKLDKLEIPPINSMRFYRKHYSVVGELLNELDGLNSPPLLKCTVHSDKTISQVFSILENKEQKNVQCSFSWMLNKDISVYTYPNSVDPIDAYHFKDIYQVINQGLKEAIHRKSTDFGQWLNN